MHHIYKNYFRVAITPLYDDCTNSLYLDLMYDDSSFDHFFQVMDPHCVKDQIDIDKLNQDSYADVKEIHIESIHPLAPSFVQDNLQ